MVCVFGRNFLKNEQSEPVASRETTNNVANLRNQGFKWKLGL